MADLAKAIFSRLSTDAGVSAIVGTRVFPYKQPPHEKAYPLVVYQDESPVLQRCHGGASNLWSATVRVACIARTYAGMMALRTAVIACLDRQSGAWSGVTIQGAFIQGEDANEVSSPELAEEAYYVSDLSFIVWGND